MAKDLAHRWELVWNRPIRQLSGGQQRLAALLVALSARPQVLLLDEPAGGLDPVARRSLNECLVEALMRGEGCTVLLSTHLIGDLERLATYVGIMDRGRLFVSGEVEEWQRTLRRVQVVFAESKPPREFSIPGALATQTLGPVVTSIARVVDDNQLQNIRMIPGTRVNVFPVTLEELFVDLFRHQSEFVLATKSSTPEESQTSTTFS